MNITMNEKNIELNESSNLADALKLYDSAHGVYVVAVNGQFISRLHYADTTLYPNDRIDIIVPMQGG